MRMGIAEGVGAALSNMNDDRAYYLLSGDLGQMGAIYRTLLDAGFPVVKSNVYPGFAKDQESEFVRALTYLFGHRIEGWWNQETALIKYGICTPETYRAALG